MDIERFKACAEAYGADPRRWPERDRATYARFADTPEGAAVLAAAERTDLFLDAWRTASPEASLAARIAGAASSRQPPIFRRRTLAWSAAAFALSAVLGFAIGFAQAPEDAGLEVAARLLMGPESAQEIGL